MSSLHSATFRTTEIKLPAARQPDWYALQTRVHFERSICSHILGKGHEAYVPVTRQRRRWSDRQQIVESPFFLGYVFVRAGLEPADKLAILQTGGAYSFVTFGGLSARIPDLQIQDLRRIEASGAPWSAHAYLIAGSRIRIRGGCLEGLEGIFVEERGEKLVVSIAPMQRSIAVDVDEYEIELL